MFILLKSNIVLDHTTRATTSKSKCTAYYIEIRPCTAMPQSKPTYHFDWSDMLRGNISLLEGV